MGDIVDKSTRSRMMSGIQGKNTRPEVTVRCGLHSMGFRYRLHDKRLPGKPDIVFPKYKAAMFVNGCFWHMHQCHLFKWPSTRPVFWREKLEANAVRDLRKIRECEAEGWKVLVIWECALKGKSRRALHEVLQTASAWLQYDPASAEITGRQAYDPSREGKEWVV
jgi:DNA mismatch endonuclease, patch repair protein